MRAPYTAHAPHGNAVRMQARMQAMRRDAPLPPSPTPLSPTASQPRASATPPPLSNGHGSSNGSSNGSSSNDGTGAANSISPVHRRRPRQQPQRQQAQQQDAEDPNLALLQTLLLVSTNGLLQSLSSAEALMGSATARVRRLIEPPPPGFPPGPPGDQAVTLLLDPLDFLTRTTRRHGSVVGLLLGTERVVLVTDKALAKQVMIDQADVFIKEGTAFFPGSSLAGNGLLVSDGDVWRRQRRLSNPAFRRAAIDGYAAAMVNSTQSMLERKWATGQVRDVYADFNTLTLEVTLEALFGFAISPPPPPQRGQTHNSGTQRQPPQHSLATSSTPTDGNGHALDSRNSKNKTGSIEERQASQIVGAVQRAFEFFSRRAGSAFTLPEWVPTLDNLEFGQAVQQLDKVVFEIIDRRRAELASAGRAPGAAGASSGRAFAATHGPNGSSSALASSSRAGGAQAAGVGEEGSPKQPEELGAAAPAAAVRSDLLQALMTAVDDNGVGMSDRALRDELMTMLVAGQETSAILLGWACALLAHHPAAQERAAQEVAAVLGGTIRAGGRAPCAGDVRRLRYIEAVVLEALRLYSPAYMVGRCTCKDVKLGQYSLEAGTTVLVSPYIMHRNPLEWSPAPDTFAPERWTALQEAPGYPGYMAFMSNMGEAAPGAYLPFGAGPRNCIGTGFAMMEAILVLASVLQRYRLSPAPSSPSFPRPKPLITLRPEAVPLLLTQR